MATSKPDRCCQCRYYGDIGTRPGRNTGEKCYGLPPRVQRIGPSGNTSAHDKTIRPWVKADDKACSLFDNGKIDPHRPTGRRAISIGE